MTSYETQARNLVSAMNSEQKQTLVSILTKYTKSEHALLLENVLLLKDDPELLKTLFECEDAKSAKRNFSTVENCFNELQSAGLI